MTFKQRTFDSSANIQRYWKNEQQPNIQLRRDVERLFRTHTNTEMAEELGQPIGTIKSMIRRMGLRRE